MSWSLRKLLLVSFFFCVMKGVFCCNFYLQVVCLSVFSWAKGFFVFHVVKAKLIACLRFLGCHERCVLFFCCNSYLKVVCLSVFSWEKGVFFILCGECCFIACVFLKLFVCLCSLGRKVFFLYFMWWMLFACLRFLLGVMEGVCCFLL